MKDFKIFGAYVGPFWWYEVEAWMHRTDRTYLRGSEGSVSESTTSGHAPHLPHPAYKDKSPQIP
jgi:hypothetical protein